MADLNSIAKRIHNISPKPVRLTLSDGSGAVYHFSGTQFFQQEFQGEGTCEADDADYRLITSEDYESVLLGRKGPEDEGWSMVGEVTSAERAE
jgi:hypothetical protein